MEMWGAMLQLSETWINKLRQLVSCTPRGFGVLDPCYYLNAEAFNFCLGFNLGEVHCCFLFMLFSKTKVISKQALPEMH